MVDFLQLSVVSCFLITDSVSFFKNVNNYAVIYSFNFDRVMRCIYNLGIQMSDVNMYRHSMQIVCTPNAILYKYDLTLVQAVT